MKPFRWNPEKNETLKAERGVSFESIVVAIESGGPVSYTHLTLPTSDLV